MLVLAESKLRSNAVDAAVGGHQQRFDIAAVFRVVDLSELLPDGTILDFFSSAFEDDRFVGFLSADHNVRVRGDVPCFSRTRPGAKPKGVLPPHSPNKREVRAA